MITTMRGRLFFLQIPIQYTNHERNKNKKRGENMNTLEQTYKSNQNLKMRFAHGLISEKNVFWSIEWWIQGQSDKLSSPDPPHLVPWDRPNFATRLVKPVFGKDITKTNLTTIELTRYRQFHCFFSYKYQIHQQNTRANWNQDCCAAGE